MTSNWCRIQRTIQSFLSTFYIYSKNSLVTIQPNREKKKKKKYIYQLLFQIKLKLKKKLLKKKIYQIYIHFFDQNEKSKVKEKSVNIKICQWVHYKFIVKKIPPFCPILYSWLYFRGWSTVAVCTFSLYVCKNGHHDITSISSTWANWVWPR